MIITIRTGYYSEYSIAYSESIIDSVSMNIIVHYNLGYQLWYMIVCTFVTPIFGVLMFFSVHHFRTQTLNSCRVIFDFLSILKQTNLLDIKDKLMLNKSRVEQAINYINY